MGFCLHLMCDLIELFVVVIQIYRSSILISRNNFVYNVWAFLYRFKQNLNTFGNSFGGMIRIPKMRINSNS